MLFGKKKDFKFYYGGSWAKFGDEYIYQKDVTRETLKHMRLIDILNPYKLVEASFYVFDIMNHSIAEPPIESDWKFKFIKEKGT